MARVEIPSIELTIQGAREPSSTTIASVGAYAVIVATVVPGRGVTLTSCYLAAMVGDVAATHLSSAPGRRPQIHHRVLPGEQPGETHARVCLLDHVAELQAIAGDVVDNVVAIDVGPAALEHAARVWRKPSDP